MRSYFKNILQFVIFFQLLLSASGTELKIVSLSPAITEIICALDKEALLIGRSAACDYPESVKTLPVAGDFATPNVELIVSLSPQWVLTDTFQDPAVKKQLEALGVKVKLLPLNSFDDYWRAVDFLEELLECPEKGKLNVSISEEATKETDEKIKVLLLFWDDPPVSCGKRSFMNDFLRMSGGQNVLGNVDDGYFYPSLETIVAAAPDVIIYPETEGMSMKNIMKLDSIPAIKNRRIYCVKNVDVLCRMSPRWPEAVKILKKIISEK